MARLKTALRAGKKSIRTGAWSTQPVRRGDSIVSYETYQDCRRCFGSAPDRDQQRQHRCPVIPEQSWQPPGRAIAAYLGATCDDGREPPESNEDGCPGSWYRCEWFSSLTRYLRPCSEGVYSSNPILDRTDDRVILEAIQYYEVEQSRHRSWYHRVSSDLRK